jgi:hypothetical protein
LIYPPRDLLIFKMLLATLVRIFAAIAAFGAFRTFGAFGAFGAFRAARSIPFGGGRSSSAVF